MAARTVRLFQDQNVIDHVNEAGAMSGKTDFTGQRKSKVGGRKPLGDLSNSVKPMNLADGKKSLNGSLNTVKSSVSQTSKALKFKEKNLEIDKRTDIKASKKSNTGSRRALSDISNSEKLHVHDVKNKNLKTCSLTIAEEGMLHNHEECIKSQTQTVDIHHFFKTVGLEDDSDDHMKISFEQNAFGKLKREDSFFELEEVPEELPVVQSLSADPGSPVHCKTPKFSSSTMWDDLAVNFKLIDSP